MIERIISLVVPDNTIIITTIYLEILNMEIPQLNLNEIGLQNENPSRSVLANFGFRLHDAFKSVGFAYIINHGINTDLINKAMTSSNTYFSLSAEVKEAFPREPDVQQGYVAPGREIFDQKEDGTKVHNFDNLAMQIAMQVIELLCDP
jgi:isopenicillin N synthase-like dioxygenase